MSILDQIREELARPEVGGNWYIWAVIALAHVLLGALFISVLDMVTGEWGFWQAQVIRLGIVISYIGLKEMGDLGRGGSLWDSIVDAGFVYLGTFYPALWVPLSAFLAALVGVVLILLRR